MRDTAALNLLLPVLRHNQHLCALLVLPLPLLLLLLLNLSQG
jgi:hypothetical protein